MYQSRLLRTAAYIATVCLIIIAIIVFGFRRGTPDNHADEGTVDHRPVFSDFNRDVNISDGVFTENCLTVISAKRFNDTHNAMPNKNIIYSLEDNKSFFSIDNAGCLRMKTSINTLMANGKINWCIYIIASDEKYPMNTNKVAININLKKKMQMDNAYLYNNKSDKNNVPELLETTKSPSNQTEQKYKIPTTTLDNEKLIDNSTPKFNVEINKKKNEFSQPIYIESKNATVDTPVTKHIIGLTTNSDQVEFKLLHNDTNDFLISHANDSDETNVLELLETTESFPNEKEQQYEIPITTLDKEKSFDNFTPKLNVKINKKQEEKECNFSQPNYIAFISENATVDTPVTKPLEVNSLGQVEFKILHNDTNDFSISHIFSNDRNKNINSTQIIVNQALSYLNKSIYKFYIMASDDISICISKIIIYVRKENDTGITFKKRRDGNDTTCYDYFSNFDYETFYMPPDSYEGITDVRAVDTYFENGLADNPIIYDIRIISMEQSPSDRNEEILNEPILAIDEKTGDITIIRYSYGTSRQKLAVQAYYKQDDSVEPLMSKCVFKIFMSFNRNEDYLHYYYLKN